jgi:MFS family permease
MRGLTGRFAALRERNFRNLFLGQSVSVIGDGITPVAITFAVLDLTGSPTDLGLVLAAQSIPLVALALVGGVWADRLRRERVMLVSDIVRACVQGVVAALLLTGGAQIWQLMVLLAVYGVAEAFFRPAWGGLLPQLVPMQRLQEANALMGISDNFGWLVGPAIAGTLIAAVGPGGAIAIDAATFVVSAAFLSTIVAPPLEHRRARERFMAELRQGWIEVKSRRWLWVMLLRTCLVLFAAIAPFQILGPLMLREHGQGAAAWGFIMAVFSAGMIAGGAFAMRYRPGRPMVVVAITGASGCLSPLALALGGYVPALLVTESVHGLAVGVLVAVWNTTVQSQVPRDAVARVTAWDWMSSLALWPVGLAISGPLVAALGFTTAAWLSGTVGLACSLWVLGVKDVWRLRPAPGLSGVQPADA